MRIALEIPPGLVSDDTTFAAAGRYEDANNVRFWRGKPQTIGGWSAMMGDTLTGVCRNTLSWSDNDAALNIAFGTHSALHVAAGGGLYTITPAGLAAGGEHGAFGPGYGADAYDVDTYGTPRTNYAPRTWSLATYGQTLIASPRDGTIYQWSNNPAAVAVAVTNAPASCTYVLVTPERQVLAFGCNEESSGVFNPLCIRGSDIENPTQWTTSTANNAFEHILEGGGKIIAARLFGNGVAVWTDNSVYFGQFIGDIGQAYRFDRIEENCGLIGPNAVTVVNQVAYWIGPDFQFRAWTLGAVPQIVPCPIRNDFADNVANAQHDKIAAGSISKYGEVWWFYPDARDGDENSRYVAVSTVDGTWFRGQLARSSFADAGVAGYPIGVDPDGTVYYHEIGQTANGGPLEWHIKSADQYLGDGSQCMMVRSVWPDFENQRGSVSLTVNVRQYPQSTAVEKGPYSLTRTASKKDFRASGRVVSVEFAGASAPSFARLGSPVFDVIPTGMR